MQLPGFPDDRATLARPKRILLIDAHTAFRQALAILIVQTGIAADVRQARTLQEPCQDPVDVDLIVIALDRVDAQDVAFLNEVRRHHPRTRILGLANATGQATDAAAG